jgi:hypothetical protein
VTVSNTSPELLTGTPEVEAEVTNARKLPSGVSGDGPEAKAEAATGYGCGLHGDTAAKQVSYTSKEPEPIEGAAMALM